MRRIPCNHTPGSSDLPSNRRESASPGTRPAIPQWLSRRKRRKEGVCPRKRARNPPKPPARRHRQGRPRRLDSVGQSARGQSPQGACKEISQGFEQPQAPKASQKAPETASKVRLPRAAPPQSHRHEGRSEIVKIRAASPASQIRLGSAPRVPRRPPSICRATAATPSRWPTMPARSWCCSSIRARTRRAAPRRRSTSPG